MSISRVVLPPELYDQLHALVKWQFDAPVPLGDRVIDSLIEVEMGIWEKAGIHGYCGTTFGLDFELVVQEDEGGPEIAVAKGEAI